MKTDAKVYAMLNAMTRDELRAVLEASGQGTWPSQRGAELYELARAGYESGAIGPEIIVECYDKS